MFIQTLIYKVILSGLSFNYDMQQNMGTFAFYIFYHSRCGTFVSYIMMSVSMVWQQCTLKSFWGWIYLHKIFSHQTRANTNKQIHKCLRRNCDAVQTDTVLTSKGSGEKGILCYEYRIPRELFEGDPNETRRQEHQRHRSRNFVYMTGSQLQEVKIAVLF